MGMLALIAAASFFSNRDFELFRQAQYKPLSTIAKKDRADSGTYRVQAIQLLLLKSNGNRLARVGKLL